MKTLKTYVLFFTLFLGVAFVTSTSASAADEINLNESAFYLSEFDAKVVAFKQLETGELAILTEDEHTLLTKDLDADSSSEIDLRHLNSNLIVPLGSYRYWYEYKPKSSYTLIGTPLRVTNDINCTTSNGCSLGHNTTYTRQVSVSYQFTNSSEAAYLKTQLGITFNSAEAITSSFVFGLKRGEKGYIAFRPYYNAKEGDLRFCQNQGGGCTTWKYTRTLIPQKLHNGDAKGIFYFAFIN